MKRLISLVVAAGVGAGFAASALVLAQDAKKAAKPAAAPAARETKKAAKAAPADPRAALVNDLLRFAVAAAAAQPPPAVREAVQVKVQLVAAPAQPVVIEKRVQNVAAKAEVKEADALDHPFLPGLDDARAAPVVMVPPAEAAPDPLVQQFLPQFRQLMRTEIHVVQTVCELSKDQRRQLDQEGDKAARAASKQYAEFQQKMMQGQWNGHDAAPEPRTLVRDSLAGLLKAQLSLDQAARYKDELEQRKADRKNVAVQNLVAKLDDELVLNAEQRETIRKSLLKNWQDEWGQSLEMFVNNDQFFPNIPDQFVTPFLNKTQKQVWQGLPKNGGVFFGGFGLNFVADLDLGEVEVAVENADAIVVEKPVEDEKAKPK